MGGGAWAALGGGADGGRGEVWGSRGGFGVRGGSLRGAGGGGGAGPGGSPPPAAPGRGRTRPGARSRAGAGPGRGWRPLGAEVHWGERGGAGSGAGPGGDTPPSPQATPLSGTHPQGRGVVRLRPTLMHPHRHMVSAFLATPPHLHAKSTHQHASLRMPRPLPVAPSLICIYHRPAYRNGPNPPHAPHLNITAWYPCCICISCLPNLPRPSSACSALYFHALVPLLPAL